MKKLLEIITNPQTNRLSHTRLWANAASLVATIHISLNFEDCNQAERLIIRHIEGELAKIVEFLR